MQFDVWIYTWVLKKCSLKDPSLTTQRNDITSTFPVHDTGKERGAYEGHCPALNFEI